MGRRSAVSDRGRNRRGTVAPVWDDERGQDAAGYVAVRATHLADANQRSIIEVTDAVFVAVDPQGVPRLAIRAAIGDRDASVAEVDEVPRARGGFKLEDNWMRTA